MFFLFFFLWSDKGIPKSHIQSWAGKLIWDMLYHKELIYIIILGILAIIPIILIRMGYQDIAKIFKIKIESVVQLHFTNMKIWESDYRKDINHCDCSEVQEEGFLKAFRRIILFIFLLVLGLLYIFFIS